MRKMNRDEDREHRIDTEIVVDAYDEHERAMGWYCYLEECLSFPISARCIAERSISPLRIDDEVDIIGMAPEEECGHEMFVMMRWAGRGMAVPLSQLRTLEGDEQSRQAVEDWHSWVHRGYRF